MCQGKYDSLLESFGPVKWVPKRIIDMPNVGGWFLLEITPCPPKEDMESIIADIMNNENVSVDNGRLLHADSCTSTNHKLNDIKKDVINSIKPQRFVIAISQGNHGFWDNQPIAIGLDPVIDYMHYPDHPHLNMGGVIRKNFMDPFYVPDSLCYGFKPSLVHGMTEMEMLDEVFAQVSIWLFRHQVWVATKNSTGKGSWIGLQDPPIEDKYFTYKLNPFGKCRCGSGKAYVDCHLVEHFSELHECSLKDAERIINKNIRKMSGGWMQSIQAPERHLRNNLNEILM